MHSQIVVKQDTVGEQMPIEPLRGVVLCHLAGNDYVDVKNALVRHGVTLLHASRDLHALSLAHCARPDVILMTIDDPAEPAHPFLTDLRRTHFGGTIPVIAFVPSLKQHSIAQTCLRYTSATIVWDTPAELVVAEIAQFLTKADRNYRRDDPATATVDAVFSELGSRKQRRRRRDSRSPVDELERAQTDPDRAPTRIRRIDGQPHRPGVISASGHVPRRLPTSPHQSSRG